MSYICSRLLGCCKMFAMTTAFSWQNSVSLCPASLYTPRPYLSVTSGISWLPTFWFQFLCPRVPHSRGEARVQSTPGHPPTLAPASSSLPSKPLQQSFCLDLGPHVDQHLTASEGLQNQQGPSVGQPGHQACHPAMWSSWRAWPC